MLRQLVTGTITAAALLGGGTLTGTVEPALASQAAPVPAPGFETAGASDGTRGVQTAVAPQVTARPQAASSSRPVAQSPLGGGGQNGAGPPASRLPGQDCRGLGHCAWGGQAGFTATCTTDARICRSTGAYPMSSTMVCSTQGALRTCTDQSGDALIAAGALLGTEALPGTGTLPGIGILPGTTTLPGIGILPGTTTLPGTNGGAGIAPGASFSAPGSASPGTAVGGATALR
jgi:hypothetical protein